MTAFEGVLLATALIASGTTFLCSRKTSKAMRLHKQCEMMLAENNAELEHLREECRALREKTASSSARYLGVRKLAMVADLTSEGACLCTQEGKIEWVNKSWESCTGYLLSDIKGKKPGPILQGNDTDQNAITRMREGIKNRQSFSLEVCNYTREGNKLWVQLTFKPVSNEKGLPDGYLCIQKDLTLKRITQKRLERLNERAELALCAGNYGMWDWWPQANQCEWDERCTRLFGVETPAKNYEEWLRLVHKADLPGLEAHLRAVLLGKESLKASFRLAGEKPRHLEIQGQVLKDDQGTPLRMTGLVRDTTEELELREELHLAGERLRLSLRGANDGVWEWDIERNKIHADEKWGQITGLISEAEAMSRQLFESKIHPDDLTLMRTVLDAHLAGRTPHFEVECRVSPKHGDWIWVRWRGTVVARDADGTARNLCGTYTDVTDKHRTEEALRRSALLLRQMCQQMGIAAWEIDAENFSIHWTEELDLLHAAPPDFDPSLEHFLALYPADSRKELSKALETALEKGDSFDLEVRWRGHGTDKNRWFRWMGTPVRSEGRTLAVCGLIHDVSSVREAAAQRRDLDSRLAELHQYEALSAITDDLAYDLNSMLGSLIGYQELALEDLEENSETRELIEKSMQTTNRTHDIIRQVLLLNRVKPMALIKVRPGLLVEELCEKIEHTLPDNIQLSRDIDRNCPAILGDAAQVQLALQHIAYHASGALFGASGTLEIRLREEKLTYEKAATLGLSIAGDCACVEVRVTRDQLSDQEWSQLFDHPSRDPGLNLTTAKKILAEHHGVLTVEFHPVHGGTCHAWLPLAHTVELVPPSAAPVPTGRGESIWIIDEERFIARLAKLTLERNGYLVKLFRTKEQCLEGLAEKAGTCALLLLGSSVKIEQLGEFLAEVRTHVPQMPALLLRTEANLPKLARLSLLPEPFTAADLMRGVSSALMTEQSSRIW